MLDAYDKAGPEYVAEMPLENNKILIVFKLNSACC